MAGSFRELKVWQKAFELDLEVRRLTKTFPKEEKFGLVDQINRSADSVPAQIAESHGRYFSKDEVRVLYQARGEIEETRSHLSLAYALKYVEKDTFERLDREYEGLLIGISRFIKSLSESKLT